MDYISIICLKIEVQGTSISIRCSQHTRYNVIIIDILIFMLRRWILYLSRSMFPYHSLTFWMFSSYQVMFHLEVTSRQLHSNRFEVRAWGLEMCKHWILTVTLCRQSNFSFSWTSIRWIWVISMHRNMLISQIKVKLIRWKFNWMNETQYWSVKLHI